MDACCYYGRGFKALRYTTFRLKHNVDGRDVLNLLGAPKSLPRLILRLPPPKTSDFV